MISGMRGPLQIPRRLAAWRWRTAGSAVDVAGTPDVEADAEPPTLDRLRHSDADGIVRVGGHQYRPMDDRPATASMARFLSARLTPHELVERQLLVYADDAERAAVAYVRAWSVVSLTGQEFNAVTEDEIGTAFVRLLEARCPGPIWGPPERDRRAPPEVRVPPLQRERTGR